VPVLVRQPVRVKLGKLQSKPVLRKNNGVKPR
jgi:hypothetical protein